MITLKENKLYQEIDIFSGDEQIGYAEIDIKGKMLARLNILEPYQNKGYGQKVIKMLTDKYGCNCLWVDADNKRAIHVYDKLGFKKMKPAMWVMEIGNDKHR